MTKKRVRILVSFDKKTGEVLQESARHNCRTPEQEIVWLVRRGLLPVNAINAMPKGTVGESVKLGVCNAITR